MLNINRGFVTTGTGCLLGGMLMLNLAPAQAFEVGTYKLHSHPAGSAANPLYGLRLDGLLSGDSKDIYTFDFDAPGSHMTLEYDGSSVIISGRAFGGLDAGAQYDSQQSGYWDINFIYDNVVHANGHLWVDAAHVGNTGSITLVDAADGASTEFKDRENQPFSLVDFAGPHSYSFKIKENHRGYDGYSGYGWLNHAPTDAGPGGTLDNHLYASDWLFKVGDPVSTPEPLSLLGLAAVAGLGAMAYRRKLS